MSRWNDTYAEHAYRPLWVQLVATVKNEQVEDATDGPRVAELARLKKLVEYLDALIETLDPELVPSGTWDHFYNQVQPCLQQVITFGLTRDMSHLIAANTHADNLLGYVRPYMVLPIEAARALEVAVGAKARDTERQMTALVADAAERNAEIDRAVGRIEEIRTQTEDLAERFSRLSNSLFGNDAADGLQAKVQSFAEDIEKTHSEMRALHEEAIGTTGETPSLKFEITNAAKTVKALRDAAAKDAAAIADERVAIHEFHEDAFGSDTADGLRVPGIKDALGELTTSMQQFEIHQSERYTALNQQIETLLPGATSAGLASAYTTMKKSFEAQIVWMTRTFYVCIGLLSVIALTAIVEKVGSPDGWIIFRTHSDWQTTLRGVVVRVPFLIPAVWLGYFATKRRSEAQRLQQEYAHKEAVAASYISYKKQLDELRTESTELQVELLRSTIETIGRNASTTLDGAHGDKAPVHEALEALAKLLQDADLKSVLLKLLDKP